MNGGWERLAKKIIRGEFRDLNEVKSDVRINSHTYRVYPESINYMDGCYCFLARVDGTKKLILLDYETWQGAGDFEGEDLFIEKKRARIAPLSHQNASALRRRFPFTAPVSLGRLGLSLGLGDRLGIASPGHLRLFKNTGVRPVLAQQSARELNLTGRKFCDVLDAASWAVFQEGYRLGFGADGDHLKTEEEIKAALETGFTMITLDCSEKIDNHIAGMAAKEVDRAYQSLPPEVAGPLENRYLNREFTVKDNRIFFSAGHFRRAVLVYLKAIDFIKHIYADVIKPFGTEVDFEVSIDETVTTTTPQAHFFVASELAGSGVPVTSLAPRFCGDFQKGIDYIGDVGQFDREFHVHADIAEHFGYKLSIHSGSDKFKVFPIIGRHTGVRVHVKTAGTNWLEAVRVIAKCRPALYRRIHSYALEHFEEATRYYHVTTNPANIPDISKVKDEDLAEILAQNDARQLLHITYGTVLTAGDGKGGFLFKNDIYDVLNEREEDYYEALKDHLERHVAALTTGVPGIYTPPGRIEVKTTRKKDGKSRKSN